MPNNFYQHSKKNKLTQKIGSMTPAFTIDLICKETNTTKKISFEKQTYRGNEIENLTYIREEVNGRTQGLLNKSNLNDIYESIQHSGQLFPAIGVQDDSGNVEILDGSRRRQVAILVQGQFIVWVTKSKLTLDEARYIAKTSNQQKKLSMFDLGNKFKILLADGIYSDQNELAEKEGLHKSVVSKCLHASEVSPELLSLFPDFNVLSVRNVELLIKLHKQLITKETDIALVVEKLQKQLLALSSDIYTDDEKLKTKIFELLSNEVNSSAEVKQRSTPEKIHLYKSDRSRYISLVKKSDKKEVITLSQIDQEKRNKIVQFIEDVMTN